MKKALACAVGTFAATGIVFILFVLGASIQPSAKAKAARSQHDISTLHPGEYRFESFGRDSAWNEIVLLVKDWDETLYVYLLPTKDSKVILPERWWGYGYYECSKFSPEADESGKLLKGGIIKCHDKETPEWGSSLWQWAYNGSPKDDWGIKMYSPPVEAKNGMLYINR
ncbi:hypothetical protein HNE05_08065 [Aquipseudomonas campi]|uniref:Uncharacterized protein n=1 Tax=Aquipseudomonas campi TaxID=2731681 RepID=A0A6M8FH88_9GAMM|nr:hypothetical protein [Pseudomonas campi]QKE63319.1 hypothetical protein HNE05_08065 [Pseudomonas campi]